MEKMMQISDAIGELIEQIVEIADDNGTDRDATLRKAARLLNEFCAFASLEDYEPRRGKE